jgi:hypothetical protein
MNDLLSEDVEQHLPEINQKICEIKKLLSESDMGSTIDFLKKLVKLFFEYEELVDMSDTFRGLY